MKSIFLSLALILTFTPMGVKAMTVDADPRIDVNVQKVTAGGWVIEGEWTKCDAAAPMTYSPVKECTIQGKLLKTTTDIDGVAYKQGTEGEWKFKFSSLPAVRQLVPQPGQTGIFMLRQRHQETKMTSFIPGSSIFFKNEGGQVKAINLPAEQGLQLQNPAAIESADNIKALGSGITRQNISKALQSFRNYSQQSANMKMLGDGGTSPAEVGIPAEDVSTVVQAYVNVIYGSQK